MILTPVSGHPTVSFVIIGLAFGLPAGALMSLLPGAVPPDRLATGLGVYYTVFYLGIAAALPLAGVVRDVSGNPAAPVMCAAVATAVTVLALGLFRALEGHRGADLLARVSSGVD
jgi:predicted MFS family arabinose efflux permease